MNDALPSATTSEQDRTTAGQRRINLIWETTQACIAVSIVMANVIAAFYLPAQNTLLANARDGVEVHAACVIGAVAD